MTLDPRTLLSDLGKAPPRAKLALFLGLALVLAVATIANSFSARPHFVLLYSGLDDGERVAVEKALAEGRVAYRVSAPPAPFAVYVNDEQFDDAQIQVALAEALKRSPGGINSGAEGASTIFMSSGERAQSMLKREWQETERLLEQLDFVGRATVTSSLPDSSPLKKREPPTVSVALKLEGDTQLTPGQARSVGKLVRFRFGVPAENVVITDQSGRILYDESEAERGGLGGVDPLQHAEAFDRQVTDRANAYLAATYGAGKVSVAVKSEWDFDQQTSVSETLEGDPKERTVRKTETRTPQGSEPNVGGVSSLEPAAGVDSKSSEGSTGPLQLATTKEEDTEYEVPRQKTQTVRVAPVLKRLFVSLAIDQSLATRKAEVQALVEAAVGFDSQRQDVIGLTTTDLAAAAATETNSEEDPAAGTAAGEDEGGGPSESTRMWLERGVELLSAAAFLVVLLLGLKRARAAGKAYSTGAGVEGNTGEPGLSLDAQALARAQIEELVRTDPRRVGEILSRWAAEDSLAKTG
jgi:flagellar M-ring protein FliF